MENISNDTAHKIIDHILYVVLNRLMKAKSKYAPILKEVRELVKTTLDAISDKKLTEEEIEAIIKEAQDLIEQIKGKN